MRKKEENPHMNGTCIGNLGAWGYVPYPVGWGLEVEDRIQMVADVDFQRISQLGEITPL